MPCLAHVLKVRFIVVSKFTYSKSHPFWCTVTYTFWQTLLAHIHYDDGDVTISVTSSKHLCASIITPLPCPSSFWQALLFSLLITLPVSEHHISGACSVQSLESGFFPLVSCIWDSPMCSCVYVFCSLLLLRSVPFHGCTMVLFPIHLFKNLECLQFGVIIKAAMNIAYRFYLCMYIFMLYVYFLG